MLLENNLIHIRPHMRSVGPCRGHGEAGGGDVTSKCRVTAANQTPEEEARRQITGNCSTTTTVTQRESEAWTDDEFELLLNITLE